MNKENIARIGDQQIIQIVEPNYSMIIGNWYRTAFLNFNCKQMNFKNIILLLLLSAASITSMAQLPLVPYPVSVKQNAGVFKPDSATSVFFDGLEQKHVAHRAAVAFNIPPNRVKIMNDNSVQNAVMISLIIPNDQKLGMEGYHLQIDQNRIVLQANHTAGLQYGLQTLMQLMDTYADNSLPAVEITDYPRFGYRGLHLDVSRHFQPLSLIYNLLDQLEKHKMNVFHWHLVDDQGWRIEIKKYPKLTEIGAWRADLSDRHWNERPLKTDLEPTYGGYYTQEEIKSVVAYAAARNIRVIPEIEMPAHVMSALAAYPQYSCTGENMGVPPGGVWPITHIYCAGNDATFDFLENILTEVMALFPSEFIHIGGDEADKTEWKKCPKCQHRIESEGLKDEHELQSYFIHRIEKFINASGKRLIGWDEILEGGLAPNATVMSWRGEDGGIAAARMGHDVIMTPGTHCYFDHYQGDPSMEPLAIGGYTTLKKVYGYEPVPSLLESQFHKHVLGAQANVWTEYMPVPEHVEYMIFPRLAALSEVLWSPKENRDWKNFSRRMESQYQRYQKDSIHFSLSSFQVSAETQPDPETKELIIRLSSDADSPEIRFTINGAEPTATDQLYQQPIRISESTTLKAAVYTNEQKRGKAFTANYSIHKAFACSTTLAKPSSKKYDGTGPFTLTDGVFGSINHSDGLWKGFLADDMGAVIDLNEVKTVAKVSLHALQRTASWIFFPTKILVELSKDGQVFYEWGFLDIENEVLANGNLTHDFEITSTAKETRYIRVTAFNRKTCPENHPGAGKSSWMFISEIGVE